MKNVLFLGAGFSAPFGLPVMNSFFQTARNSDILKAEEKRFLVEVQRFANTGVRLIEMPRNNLEAILSFLVMAEQIGVLPKEVEDGVSNCGGKNATHLFRKILGCIYGPVAVKKLEKHRYDFENHNYYSDGNELTIITTNYDLNAETMMLSLGHRINIPGNWISTSGIITEHDINFSLYDVNSKIMICKLHGSVNWRDASNVEDTDKFVVENRVGHDTPLLKQDETVRRYSADHRSVEIMLPMACQTNFHRNSTLAPIIVPPTLFKHQSDLRFLPIWEAAGKALREADRIAFVGYSFPESDTYMRYFLAASMAENTGLEGVAVLDLLADEICDRLRGNKHYGSHFKELMHPITDTWTNQSPWGPF